ncbi:hypothetical protein AV530_009271 [Patagioenas fasciata monilis]|uniref:Uncharacterized protein n=1 Tax=Patagioenas fasciata monilis TaxID=372326 RepID=A0A1V4JID8_PATFA|nr:hypothetical protein AV530_009271 [Patagioenas fasciata monilis]
MCAVGCSRQLALQPLLCLGTALMIELGLLCLGNLSFPCTHVVGSEACTGPAAAFTAPQPNRFAFLRFLVALDSLHTGDVLSPSQKIFCCTKKYEESA